MKAKYAGDCDRCPDPIKRGENIIIKQVLGMPVMIHPRCASGQEDGGKTYTPKAAKKTAQTKMFVSGFCNPSNPPDSHARCRIVAGDLLCTCECHTSVAGEEEEPRDHGARVEPLQTEAAVAAAPVPRPPVCPCLPGAPAHTCGEGGYAELDLTPGSPEWCRRVSPSKVAAILGISPWESQRAMYHKMRGEIPWDEENEAMERGNLLESGVLAWWRKHHDHEDWREQAIFTIDDWLVATPDAACTHEGEPILVEAKTASNDDDWGDPGTDIIPNYYLVQTFLAGYVATRNGYPVKRIHVPMLGPRLRFANYVVEYDHAYGVELEARMREWYESLSSDVPPPLDGSLSTYNAVRKLHKDIDLDLEMPIPPDVAAELVHAIANLNEGKDRDRLARSTVIDLMGRARYAVCNGTKIARRQPDGPDRTKFVPVAKDTLFLITESELTA